MINKSESAYLGERFWRLLFTSGSEAQINQVQQQLDHFKYTFNPVFNANQLKIQIRLAFLMNLSYIYISYFILGSKFQLQEIWFINYAWLFIMSILNLLLIFPKILLIMMIYYLIRNSNNIDDLIQNVEQFIKSKVFICNQTVSKIIVYGYVVGFCVCVANMLLETDESYELGSLINYLQIIFTSRMIYASIANTREEKGLNQDQIKQTIQGLSYTISEQEVKELHDCCSICVEDYVGLENVIRLNCKHLFHTHCIQKWFPIQNKCPNCNQYILKQL